MFFLLLRRAPRANRSYTNFPYTALFRSGCGGAALRGTPQRRPAPAPRRRRRAGACGAVGGRGPAGRAPGRTRWRSRSGLRRPGPRRSSASRRATSSSLDVGGDRGKQVAAEEVLARLALEAGDLLVAAGVDVHRLLGGAEGVPQGEGGVAGHELVVGLVQEQDRDGDGCRVRGHLVVARSERVEAEQDRKSTRLNSSH